MILVDNPRVIFFSRALGEAVRDSNELTLQVPADGSTRSLKAVLDRLGHEVRIGPEVLSPVPG